MRKKVLVVAVTLAAVLFASPDRALAFCEIPDAASRLPFRSGLCDKIRSIGVHLHDRLGDGMVLGFPIETVEQQLKAAIATWNAGVGADVKLVYRGILTGDPTEPPSGNIIVRETNDCEKCDGPDKACSRWDVGLFVFCGRVATRGYIYLMEDPACYFGSRTWTLDCQDSDPTCIDLKGVLTHELGHHFKLDHPRRCGECDIPFQRCGTMDADDTETQYARNLGRWDVENTTEIYGGRNVDIEFKESVTALLWSDGTPSIPSSFESTFPVAAAGVTSDEFVELLAFVRFPGYFVEILKGDVFDWFFHTTIPDNFGRTYDPPAIAAREGSSFEYVAAWTAVEAYDANSKFIRFAETFDGGVTWTGRFLTDGVSSALTHREGVSVEHDPVSDRYLISWLDDEDFIWVAVHTPGLPVAAFTKLNVQAIDPPGIACRPEGNTNNCLMVWADIGRWHCLWEVPFVVDGTDHIQVATADRQCFLNYVGPTVTHNEEEPLTPYRVAIKQDRTLFTWKRGRADADDLTDERQVDLGAWFPWPPALGTVRAVGKAEETNLFYGDIF